MVPSLSNPQKMQPVADIHIHVQPWTQLKPDVMEKFKARPEITPLMEDPQKLLAFMDQEGIRAAALINYVSPDVMGFTSSVNEFVSEFCRQAPKRLIPVGAVNPLHTADAGKEAIRIIDRLGIRMLKIHPPHMLFAPNAYVDGLEGLRDVYRVAQERKIPVMIHTGTSFFPGARIKYGDPIHVDDVAVDFPELTILLAHGGRPLWMETAFYLLRRHANVHFDISGIPPNRLLEWFPRLADVAHKTYFGSDWPEPTVKGMGANARMIAGLPLAEDVKRKILWENAAALFGLSES